MLIMFILMFLPVFALPVFWLLPLGQAVAAYLASLLISGSMMWLMHGTMRRPAATGIESLIGKRVEVVAQSRQGDRAVYTVRVEGELWSARSLDILEPGDKVVISTVDGNTLTVKRQR